MDFVCLESFDVVVVREKVCWMACGVALPSCPFRKMVFYTTAHIIDILTPLALDPRTPANSFFLGLSNCIISMRRDDSLLICSASTPLPPFRPPSFSEKKTKKPPSAKMQLPLNSICFFSCRAFASDWSFRPFAERSARSAPAYATAPSRWSCGTFRLRSDCPWRTSRTIECPFGGRSAVHPLWWPLCDWDRRSCCRLFVCWNGIIEWCFSWLVAFSAISDWTYLILYLQHHSYARFPATIA